MAKKKAGHPTSYKPEYCQEIINYFSRSPYEVTRDFKHGRQEVPNEFPTFLKFAIKIGVHYDTLREWVKVHKEFSESYNVAKRLQQEFLTENALRGNYAPAYAIFMQKNCNRWQDEETKNWSDRNELSGPEGGPIQLIL